MSSTSSPDSPHTASSPISPGDLRHMTSATGLHSPGKESHRASRRTSQHLRTTDAWAGSRSPTSIPSSPTSMHSCSSAIFERDIEPIAPPSPPHHPPNPHRIPRSKGTEQLEHSVPSVLDSAAAILGSTEDPEGRDQVAVVAPATTSPLGDLFGLGAGRSSGFASPIGSLRSRSPSPLGGRSPVGREAPSLLLNIPQPMSPPGAHLTPSSASSPQAAPVSSIIHLAPQLASALSTGSDAATAGITPSIVTPTSAYFSTTSSIPESESSSPTTTTLEHPPHPLPPSPRSGLTSPNTLASPTSTAGTSHPPSPSSALTKRLSFMSYSDLLSSTPASTLPLSSLTTAASTSEPPPHIPSLQQYTSPSGAASAAGSLRGFPMGGITHPGKRDSILLLDDLGGEWEREGLGRGLEERLERLIPVGSLVGSPVGAGLGIQGKA